MRFLTAGESHGPGLVVIIDGVPRGLEVCTAALARDLARRRGGYGRGPRAVAEPEQVEILAGVRAGRTTGAPVAVVLHHQHWETWRSLLAPECPPAEGELSAPGPDLAGVAPRPTRPRPGHADLAGARKYGLTDLRDVIERASARETAARTVAGSLARTLLGYLGIEIGSYVASIGPVSARADLELSEALQAAENSPVRVPDPQAEPGMMAAIDAARDAGDTLGGTFIVAACGVPAGLGSYTQWGNRLDGRLAGAVMSIPSVKGVEIGAGFALAALSGRAAHDAIRIDPAKGIWRASNRAGGLEGGLTNGEPILIRAAVKPVPTLYEPLLSVDLADGEPAPAAVERSDTCVVPAAAVVAEAMMAWVLAEACVEKFGGDTLAEMERALASYKAGWPWRGDG